MTENPLSTITGFDTAVRRAWAAVSVWDDLAHALRTHRRELRLSQREYARARSISRHRLSRIEAGQPGRVAIADVDDLLAGTGWVLAVVPEGTDIAALRPSGAVPSVDLVARDDAGRRLPAHLMVKPANAFPPDWWWARHGGWSTRATKPAWHCERRL